jgi:signal transduction histidine kinase
LKAQADPVLMEALLQNLLHNAWKYTANEPQAQIRVFAREHGGQRHFCVSDNGAGFDMARAGKLFQPFHRLHLRREYEGNGLGLSLCEQIAQAHGGSISVTSVPGEGSRFVVKLPLA